MRMQLNKAKHDFIHIIKLTLSTMLRVWVMSMMGLLTAIKRSHGNTMGNLL